MQRSSRSSTARDVATRAGVSLGTVSRVLNNQPTVGEAIRHRVEEAMRELGYRSRKLGQDVSVLSFVLSNRTFVQPVHPLMLEGASDYCEENGYLILFSRFDYDRTAVMDEISLPRLLRNHGVADSMVLAGLQHANLLEVLQRARIPYVLLANAFDADVPLEPWDQVSFDDRTGSMRATEYLLSLGHRKILFIGDTSLRWFRDRFEGYSAAMRNHGLAPLAQTATLSDDAFSNGQASVDLMFEQRVSFTAVIAGLDPIAYGVLEALRDRGLDVPRDISLIGFGDFHRGERRPALTSVQIPATEVGRQLARMAAQKGVSGGRVPAVTLPCPLVRRQTCRPCIDD